MRQLRIVRKYVCGDSISDHMADAIVNSKIASLEIIRDFTPKENDDFATPFKEVFNMPCDMAINPPVIEGPREKPLELAALAEAIEQAVYESWNPQAFNVVFHSNGIDSRICSHFIRKAYLARPGPILFVCFYPEYDNFVNIMKYEGWTPDQYIEYNILKDEGIWDFKALHEKVNGCSNIPWSKPLSSIRHLKKIGKIPPTVTTWASVYCNETLGWPGEFKGFILNYYYSRYSRMTQGFHVPVIQPLLNERVLRTIFTAKQWAPNHTPTRKALLALIDPGLAAIPKMEFALKYEVSSAEFAKLVEGYCNSYYFKTFKPVIEPSPHIWEQGEWWSKATLASFIDHLIGLGVKIS